MSSKPSPRIVLAMFVALWGASAAAQQAGPARTERIDPRKPGAFASGKWQYQYDITAPGTRAEGRWGWLSFDGQRLPPAEANDYYDTPWGPLYWVGIAAIRSGDHGWMPAPTTQAGKGKRLVAPAESAPAVEITAADDGKTVNAPAGKSLSIRLEGNPTTGHRWQQSELKGDALQAAGEPKYVRKAAAAGAVGSGGHFEFSYKAVKSGEATVTLVYLKPWEKDKPPEKTFNVTVKVVADAAAKAPKRVP